jgi:hypothetical protein
MRDANGNRIPANQHPRTLPSVHLPVSGASDGLGFELLAFVFWVLVIGGVGATAVMVFAKVAAWAWS